jgi:peptide/nickel transport system ATP-binding protein
MASLLEVDHLSVDFPTDDGVVHAVRDVSFTLEPGDVLGIVGESGSGKSVTSMAVMGLLPKTARISGSIRFKGEQLVGRKANAMKALRGAQLAMVFQDPMTSLNPVYTVGWQLSEAVRAHNDVSKAAAWKRAVEMLDLVGIPQPADRAKCYPHEFSGGMRQRAMIAMAIANDPEVIIADEPTTALDVTVQAQILELLVKIKDETSAAIVLITHDLGVVAGMVDRMLVMYAGTVVESGTTDDVFFNPMMPYSVGLLGSIPHVDSAGGALTPIPGAPPSLINLPPGCPFSPRCPLVREDCLAQEPPLEPADSPEHLYACLHGQELARLSNRFELFAAGSTVA